MKWPSVNESQENPVPISGMLSNGAQATNLQTVPEMARPVSSRSQDDAMVTYFFQRAQTDADFQNFSKQHSRWALGDESLIEVKQGSGLETDIGQQTVNPTVSTQYQQILPSAKKLWGVDDQNFNLTGQTWRDTTWSTSTMDHAVSQPISMANRRSGSFPGNEVANVLSPRSSETSGLGVKMVVEYVLGTSPTSKDLDNQMRGLVINAPQEKETEKTSSPSPLKDLDGSASSHGIMLSNGLTDDDKGYSYTRNSASRQPSPSDDNLTKNPATSIPMTMVMKSDDLVMPSGASMVGPFAGTGLTGANSVGLANGIVANLGATLTNGVGATHGGGLGLSSVSGSSGGEAAAHDHHHFQQVMMEPSGMPFDNNNYSMLSTMGPQATMVPPSFEAQQLFRAHQLQQQQQQQQQPSQQQQQMQLLAQQQFMAAQQQLVGLPGATGGGPAFPAPSYVLNPQEPYMGTVFAGPAAMMPQYYSVAPWGMFPAGVLPPGPAPAPVTAAGQQVQQRRPLSPGSLAEHPPVPPQGQYQMIPAFYDQNGSLVMRGVSSGAPMRLMSPAPMVMNPAARQVGAPPTPAAAAAAGQPPVSLYNPAAQQAAQSGMGNALGTLPGMQQHASSLAGSMNTLGLQQNSSLSFGSSTLGTIGSSSLGALSVANGHASRRDSFDRTAPPTFSPSLDYTRSKWAQNYGAVGTVTASTGPLGLTQSGSMTPPPMGLASSGLQLGIGPFMPGGRIVSAAPGSEMMRFRNGSTTPSGVFSNGGSLFSKMGPIRSNGVLGVDKMTGRSRLLEDYRNNRYPNLQLRDITNHIVEFSQDQHGSRFIQQKLERAQPTEKQLVFNEILGSAYALITDVFGNYVIQKFFEFGSPEQKATLAQKIRGHVLQLALQMYGCRVIQKALESVSGEQQKELVRELDGHVLKCVKDQNGNHVVQKCIECVDPHELQFLIEAFEGQVLSLSTHPYGCRVIQRILEHCTAEQTTPVLNELHQHVEALIQDQYGNYVIQHVLEHGNPEDKSRIVGSVRGKVLQLSQHKFASNVVEKCISHATRAERSMLIEEVMGFGESSSQSPLHAMMKDQYANYVVQKMIDVAEPAQRKVLMHKIRPHISTLRKYTYGKHILAKLEKYFMKSSVDLGPIGVPPAASSNGTV